MKKKKDCVQKVGPKACELHLGYNFPAQSYNYCVKKTQIKHKKRSLKQNTFQATCLRSFVLRSKT